MIEEAFRCPVFDRYGCREFGNIAHECGQHNGYHINVERFVIEILNDHGKPVEPGESGEIIVTDLDNYGFPFIRYRTGDMAVASARICSCGRGLPLLKSIEGRVFDVVKAPNGNRIAGTFWTLALRSVPGVKHFQIEQISIDQLIVRIVKDYDYSIKSETAIIDLIRDKCGNNIEIEMIYTDNIPVTLSGKRRFIISHVGETAQ
jgi:phenylacetate-CoA ligase